MKFIQVPFYMYLPGELSLLMKRLMECKIESMVVGGSVRDAIWGRQVHDYDLAFDATTSDLIRSLDAINVRYKPVGIHFGSVLAILGELRVELTMLRGERNFSGHHNVLQVYRTRSWLEDGVRRDLTYNALYYQDGRLLMPLGSLEDVLTRHTKFMGSSRQRLSEDGLRWFRYLRFWMVNSCGQQSLRWFFKKHRYSSWRRLSPERISQEFTKMMLGISKVKLMCRMIKRLNSSGIATSLFGEHLSCSLSTVWQNVTSVMDHSRMVELLFLTTHITLPGAVRFLKKLGDQQNKSITTLLRLQSFLRDSKVSMLNPDRVKSVWSLSLMCWRDWEVYMLVAIVLFKGWPRALRLATIIYMKQGHLMPKMKPSYDLNPSRKSMFVDWWIRTPHMVNDGEVNAFFGRIKG